MPLDTADLDVGSVTVLLLTGIFLSFILQQLLIFVNYLVRNYANVKAVLQIVFQELMVIGLLSLLLFLIEYYEALAFLPFVSMYKELFDLVHFILFGIVVVYLVFILFLMWSASLTFSLWKSIDATSSLVQLQSDHQSLLNEHTCTPTFLRVFCFKRRRKLKKLQYAISFLLIKKQFFYKVDQIYEDHIHTELFPFNKYLRHASRSSFVHIAQLHWSLWLFIAVILVFNYFRVVLFSIDGEISLFVFCVFLVYSFLVILIIIDNSLFSRVVEVSRAVDVLDREPANHRQSQRQSKILLKFIAIVLFGNIGSIAAFLVYYYVNFLVLITLTIPIVIELFLIMPAIIQSFALNNYTVNVNFDVLNSLILRNSVQMNTFKKEFEDFELALDAEVDVGAEVEVE
ncbi:hypothetical protein P9112_000713 [Eukaryota sp. TZLM1-RC]